MDAIAVVGEAVADAVAVPGDGALRLDITPGGSPANTAVALSRLGTTARYLGRLSTGVLGGRLRHHLEASGVDLSGSVATDRHATLAITALDEAGKAAYDFYLDETADWHWTAAELADPAPGAGAVHTGSLALAIAPGAALITDYLRRMRPTATISIDPNARPGMVDAATYRELFPLWTTIADIIKVSDDDLAHVYPNADETRLRAAWHAAGVRLVVVTRGASGATVSLNGETRDVASRPIRVADTIGAGDAFSAGLLHRLNEAAALGGRLDDLCLDTAVDAAAFAARVAERVCAVPGADPPWAVDLEGPA